jgi:hypothetical protein
VGYRDNEWGDGARFGTDLSVATEISLWQIC